MWPSLEEGTSIAGNWINFAAAHASHAWQGCFKGNNTVERVTISDSDILGCEEVNLRGLDLRGTSHRRSLWTGAGSDGCEMKGDGCCRCICVSGPPGTAVDEHADPHLSNLLPCAAFQAPCQMPFFKMCLRKKKQASARHGSVWARPV